MADLDKIFQGIGSSDQVERVGKEIMEKLLYSENGQRQLRCQDPFFSRLSFFFVHMRKPCNLLI